jgi:HK97 family phage prohead protease
MKDELERRCLPNSELRLDTKGESPKITGYAAVFNTWTDIGGWFREMVLPGAFKKTIKEADVRALWNHDPNFVLGRNKNQTLSLKEDKKGLQIEIDPIDTTWARDLIKSMERGDVSQMSFGFQVVQAIDDFDEDTRQLKEVRLFDVSVVTYPAYPTTTAEVRSAFENQEPKPDPFEEFDAIIRKIKAKEELSDDEVRALMAFLPENISAPVENHVETEDEPGETHSDTDWLVERSKITQKLYDIGGLLQ